jgi:hypothetical protein
MKWKKFSDELPISKDTLCIVSDGNNAWIATLNKGNIFFSDPSINENESELEIKLTHWGYVDDIELPLDRSLVNYNMAWNNYIDSLEDEYADSMK